MPAAWLEAIQVREHDEEKIYGYGFLLAAALVLTLVGLVIGWLL